MRRFASSCMAALLLLVVAGAAFAQTSSKLDARARIAANALRASGDLAAMRVAGTAVTPAGQLNVFIQGSVSRAELEAMGITVRTALPGVYTASVPLEAVDALEASANVTSVRGASICEQSNDVSVPMTGASALRGAGPNFTGLNGAGILVGDVDTGIDVHHGDFQDAAGLSRILYVWDQNTTTTPPSGYAYGTEWTKAQIDGGTCTELDNYGATGHGTHVMGTIAGDGSKSNTSPYQFAGMAPKADITMVNTTWYDSDILDGVAWVFQKATDLGKLAVCNLSLGSSYGPHDGSSAFEAGLDALSGPGRVVCVAAGNNGGTNTHAGTDVPAAGDSIKLTVASGTTNGRLAEINGWYNVPANCTVKLRSPGNFIITLPTGTSWGAQDANGIPTTATGVNGKVYIENAIYTAPGGGQEIYIEIMSTGSGTGSINGVWTIYVTPVTMPGSTVRVDMWRDYVGNVLTGAAGPTATFSLRNTNDHLVNEPGNANRVITSAAYCSKASWLSCAGGTYTYGYTVGPKPAFSGIGPTRDGRNKPDISAPGTAIMSALSADIGVGCTSGTSPDGAFHQIMQGTSMASPHTTGAVALLLQKYGAWTPEQVKAYLFANVTLDGYTGTSWSTGYGNGKLHLGDLIDPTAIVLAANGAENWLIGTQQQILWGASDNVGVTSVDIYLSRNDVGGPWETIATGVANSGSYLWTVSGPATGLALVKVVAHDAAGNTATDQSDAIFTISDFATAALLSNFVADPVADGIELRWQLADAGAFSNFSMDRSVAGSGAWEVLSAPVSRQGESYVLVDATAAAGVSYEYRLTGVSARGITTTLGQISGTVGQAITQFALTKIAPNPTRDAATVEFTAPRAANVKVAILDVAGREISVLSSGMQSAGRHQVTWNGIANGRLAPSGMYFVRMQAPGVQATRRVTITH